MSLVYNWENINQYNNISTYYVLWTRDFLYVTIEHYITYILWQFKNKNYLKSNSLKNKKKVEQELTLIYDVFVKKIS